MPDCHAEVGSIVVGASGRAYLLAAKFANPDHIKIRLTPWAGKTAYNKDFDLYINSYIEKWNADHKGKPPLPYPIGPDDKPFRWADWFQSEIAPKIYVKTKSYEDAAAIKDEAIHEMLLNVLSERRILDEFGQKMKNFAEGAQRLSIAKQLTVFLARNFKYYVSTINKKLKPETLGRQSEQYLSYLQERLKKLKPLKKNQREREEIERKIKEIQAELGQLGDYANMPREMSMIQPSYNDEEEGETNILEQEQFGVGQGEFESAEAQRDVKKFRDGFGTWLVETQGQKVGSSFLALFDIYWDLISQSGKSRPKKDVVQSERTKRREETEPWMLTRGDIEGVWQERTGLSFGSLKDYLGRLPGLMEEYIITHAEEIGEESIFVDLMNRIRKQRPKARPARASSLNLASVEEDFSEAKAETVSPDTVDRDIQQPTVSVGEAGKRATDEAPDDGPDYYDFPKNWKEEETEETHDKKQGDWADEAQQESYRDPSEQKNRQQKGMALIKSIRPGDRVTILVPAGRGMHGQEWKEQTGRAVIVSPDHVALNMGGQHGTPGVATVGNIVRVRKAKSSTLKTAGLVAGTDLTPEMRKQVQRAFIYRWTYDNPRRAEVYHCDKCDVANDPFVNDKSAEGHQHPTIPMISDDQWIREHAFYFTNDGRLATRGDQRFAEPAYLAQHNARRVSSVAQKFAIEKAAHNPGQEVYMYKAALYCKECGEKIKQELALGGKAIPQNLDETQYDSDSYPKGPYPDGGGEADTPQHCDRCGRFLENPLTTDGYRYLREMVNEAQSRDGDDADDDILRELIEFYPEAFEGPEYASEGMEKEGMLGHDFNNADGQAIGNETLPDTGHIPHAFDQAELKPRTARGLLQKGFCKECEENPCTCDDGHKEGAEAQPDNWQCMNCGHEGMMTTSGKCEACGSEALSSVRSAPPEYARYGIAATDKIAQGSGNTTVTMQEQNVTDPMVPGKGQPMAVPEAIDQQPGPHSPNAPSTAPRTPGIQPKIVNVLPEPRRRRWMTRR